MRVLVVDDDIIIRHFFLRALRRHAEVHEATGVVDALSKLRSTTFDVVIADEHMPDGTGRALLAQARTMQARCWRVLMPRRDVAIGKSDSFDRVFPKLGGLPQLVAWLRALAATSGI
jgi:DNA-binding NtrC family response regulator